MRRMPSPSQKIEARTFPAGFCTWNLWGGVSRYAATPLIVALSPGHSNITRFCPWSPIATGNHLDRAKKNSRSCSDNWHCWHFLSVFRHFGIHFAESFRMSKSSWMMDQNCSREMPSCSAIELAEIRRSSKISSCIWSIITGVVTALGRPGRVVSQIEKLPRLNWATQFLMVAYDGACYPNVSINMAWISFSTLPYRKKSLMRARISMLLKSRASPYMLPFSLCNKKRLAIRHVNRPPFPTTLSIPSYIGKLDGLRTYQHPLIGNTTFQLYAVPIESNISVRQQSMLNIPAKWIIQITEHSLCISLNCPLLIT